MPSVPGVIDLISGPVMQGVLEREYVQEDPSKRIMAYRNKIVVGYADYIRELRGYKHHYALDEVLVNNEPIQALTAKDKSALSFGTSSPLSTDQVVQVLDRGKVYNDHNIVPNWEVKMLPLLIEPVANPGAVIATVVFDNPDHRTQALNYHKRNKNWQSFFRIKEHIPDFRACTSSTVHKAQGSTYNDAIVDLDDISRVTDKKVAARMLYVALSRPKEHVYIRGSLSPRFYE